MVELGIYNIDVSFSATDLVVRYTTLLAESPDVGKAYV